jgi:hypothetical protein
LSQFFGDCHGPERTQAASALKTRALPKVKVSLKVVKGECFPSPAPAGVGKEASWRGRRASRCERLVAVGGCWWWG